MFQRYNTSSQLRHHNSPQALLTDGTGRNPTVCFGIPWEAAAVSAWPNHNCKAKFPAVWDRSPTFSIQFFPFPQDLTALKGPWNKGMCPSYGNFDPSMQEEMKKHPTVSPWSLGWVLNPTRGTWEKAALTLQWGVVSTSSEERTKCTSEGTTSWFNAFVQWSFT